MNKENKITISTDDVAEFKTVFCDENSLIKALLKKEFISYFDGVILDVGGGTADILSDIIPDKNVIHLDILDFSKNEIPEAHSRITGDFFDDSLIKSILPVEVLFMSHVLQFIDGDLNKLNSAIRRIDAKRIILVEDMNDDFLGEVMRFSLGNFPDANPEVKIMDFPQGYVKTKSVPFTATLRCEDYHSLTRQCLYLMDIARNDSNHNIMFKYLSEKLSKPEFTINQEIVVYEKI